MLSSKGLGLRWSGQRAGNGRRRLEHLASRQFSSSTLRNGPIRASPLLSQARFPICEQSARRTQISRGSLLIRNGATIRFASTTPLPAASSTIPESATATATTPGPELTTFFEETVNAPHSPDQIGYFASLGIDYSVFRPTGAMSWILEHMHVWTGLPWWAVIVVTSAIVKISFLKIHINASENGTRMASIQARSTPLTDRMIEAAKRRDIPATARYKKELRELKESVGVETYKSLLPILSVFPSMGTFFTVRAMLAAPVPALETEGILWFHNLAAIDPFFVLPLATCYMTFNSLKTGLLSGNTAAQDPTIQKAIMYGGPALGLAVSSFFPAALQLSFAANSALGYIQAKLLASPSIRKRLNMTPLVRSRPILVDQNGAPVDDLSPLAKFRQHGADIKNTVAGIKKQVTDKLKEHQGGKEKTMAEAYEARRVREIMDEKRFASETEAENRQRKQQPKQKKQTKQKKVGKNKKKQ